MEGAELALNLHQNYYADVCMARPDNSISISVNTREGPAGVWDWGGGRPARLLATSSVT